MDNENMALHSAGIINSSELKEAVDRATARLDPQEVRRLRYSVGTDSMGETTIFLRVLLSDEVCTESRLGEVTRRISDLLWQEINPWESWGVFPDVRFRSESEQRNRYDPDWA